MAHASSAELPHDAGAGKACSRSWRRAKSAPRQCGPPPLACGGDTASPRSQRSSRPCASSSSRLRAHRPRTRQRADAARATLSRCGHPALLSPCEATGATRGEKASAPRVSRAGARAGKQPARRPARCAPARGGGAPGHSCASAWCAAGCARRPRRRPRRAPARSAAWRHPSVRKPEGRPGGGAVGGQERLWRAPPHRSLTALTRRTAHAPFDRRHTRPGCIQNTRAAAPHSVWYR